MALRLLYARFGLVWCSAWVVVFCMGVCVCMWVWVYVWVDVGILVCMSACGYFPENTLAFTSTCITPHTHLHRATRLPLRGGYSPCMMVLHRLDDQRESHVQHTPSLIARPSFAFASIGAVRFASSSSSSSSASLSSPASSIPVPSITDAPDTANAAMPAANETTFSTDLLNAVTADPDV